MKRKFEIGDRVRCVSPPDNYDKFVGFEGVVSIIGYGDLLPIEVKFEKGAPYTYWWCEESSLEIIDEEPETYEITLEEFDLGRIYI